MSPGRSGVLAALALLGAGEASARVHVDIAQLTMGRVTAPRGSLSLDVTHEYRMVRRADPTRDSFRGVYSVSYGLRDGLTLGAVSKTRLARRDAYALDRVGVGATLRVLREPVQLAPILLVLPSVHGREVQVEAGFQAARSRGPLTAFMYQKAQFENDRRRGAYGLQEYEVEPGILYRFGLQGVAGLEWEYKTSGDHMAGVVLGGSLSRFLFLGIEQKFGITGGAPDAMTRIQLGLYSGRYALGEWGF